MRFCHPRGLVIGRNQSRLFGAALLRMIHEQDAVAWTKPVLTVI
jgi:hypothetical protein